MKFLVHANAPWTKTGYGLQGAQLLARLKADGHEPAVSSTYGQQGGMAMWRDMPIYPCGYDQNGNDVIHWHAAHFFGSDEGWVIPIIDVWCLVNPTLKDFNVAAWTPVDHFPVPPDVLKFFHRNPDAVPIAMSRYGERELARAGLDPAYVPLAVDTKAYKPTPSITINGRKITGREMLSPDDPIPDDAFLVGMVAMNKGTNRDRKGFNEAFRAFGVFWKTHPSAVLYVHADWPGAAMGFNLKELAIHCGIPPHAIVFPELYAYFPHGFTPEQMAAMYTAFDVLLAPSHGEGFCVPLIEAQACGTPVIATDFAAQTELVGAGWLVEGQPEWDHDQRASYICPSVVDVVLRLEAAHDTDIVERKRLADRAVTFASQYDVDHVYETHWRPFLASLEASTEPLPLEREPIPDVEGVAVIVPAMRSENFKRLAESFEATNDGSARLWMVRDEPFSIPVRVSMESDYEDDPLLPLMDRCEWVCTEKDRTTYAEKVNIGFANSTEPWVLLVGDDVEFKPGWIEAARKVSDRFDVIGTNDTANGAKNPDVASGKHADHFLVRRSYVDTYGGCLEGPGVLAPECYRHWYTDKEIVGLAKARNVFTPCLESVVEHHHPGYDGREDLRAADPVYMQAVDHATEDAATWESRRRLIDLQRASRRK